MEISPPQAELAPAAPPAPPAVLPGTAVAEAPADLEVDIVAEEPAAGAQAVGPPESTEAPKTASKTPTEKPTATPVTGASTGEGRARRKRKAAQSVYQVEAKKEEEFVIKEGKGSKLRDIPNVAFKLSKISGKDELLESLHNVLFRRKGTANQRKKAILEFSGWAFEKSAHEKEVEGRSASLSKWKLELIHRLMEALDLSRGSGDKSTKIERAMEFLAAPRKESDIDLAAREAAKKDKVRAKRERALARKEKATKQKATAGKRKASDASAEKKGRPEKKKAKREGCEDKEESEGESELEESEAADMEEAEVMKKAPKMAPKRAAATKGEVAAAAEEQKGAGSAAPAAAAGAEDAGATDEAVPLAAEDPGQQVPSSKLAADVKAILAKMSRAELGALTIKPLTTALQQQYGFSVRSRKQEIREIAQAYADSLPPEEDA